MKVTRYDCMHSDGMCKSTTGDFVQFIDYEADLAEKDARIARLTELLETEQHLAIRDDRAFKCREIECEWYGRNVRAGDCQCYEMQSREHRAQVRAALAGEGVKNA